MIDYIPTLVELLGTILPIYPETLNQEVATPCITYFLYNDTQQETGDTLYYSYITYCVKVWDTSVGNMVNNALLIDEVLREHGFTRVSTNMQYDENLYCYVLLYRGHGKEFTNQI